MGVEICKTGDNIIPKEKRADFKEKVSEIFKQGGMFQFEKVSMFGTKIALLAHPTEDSKGYFGAYYNYFEDDRWPEFGFNLKEGWLYSEKIGSSQFNWVASAVHLLADIYTKEFSATYVGGAPIPFFPALRWLNYLFGLDGEVQERCNFWKIYELIHREDCDYFSFKNVVSHLKYYFPYKYLEDLDPLGYLNIMLVTEGIAAVKEYHQKLKDSEVFSEGLDNLVSCMESIYRFAYIILKVFLKENLPTEEQNRQVKSILDTFKQIAAGKEPDTEFSEKIDRETLLFPQVVLKALSVIIDQPFWELWEQANPKDGREEIVAVYREPIKPMTTAEFLEVSDDDMLLWWKPDGNLHFSEECKHWFQSLQEQFQQKVQENWEVPSTVEFLQKCLYDLHIADDIFYRVLMTSEAFYDFVNHSRDRNYVAAILLLEDLIEENKEEHQEIFKQCWTHSWDLMPRSVKENAARLRVKRYLAILSNKELRNSVFGF